MPIIRCGGPETSNIHGVFTTFIAYTHTHAIDKMCWDTAYTCFPPSEQFERFPSTVPSAIGGAIRRWKKGARCRWFLHRRRECVRTDQKGGREPVVVVVHGGYYIMTMRADNCRRLP